MIRQDAPQLRKFSIKHWSDLSFEQLKKVKEYQSGEYESPILMRLKIFLYLADMEIADNGSDVMVELAKNSETKLSGDNSIGSTIDLIEDYVNHDKFLLRSCSNESEMYVVDIEQLYAWCLSLTDFIDNDHTLLSLPIETIQIGKHEYKIPDAFLLNITYQQYTNAQHCLEVYWDCIKKIESIIGKYQTEDEEANVEELPQEAIAQLDNISKSMVSSQKRFLANILTPIITEGETRYDENNKAYTFTRKVAKFIAEDENIALEDMEVAPVWLFSAVYQQLQDNLRQFHTKFPDLFRESESSSNKKQSALVAELGTINMVIEKGGYPSAAAVYNENAIFIFKRLDMINEEARETKKAMEGNKKKR